MKKLLFLALFLGSCASFQPIAFQNQAVLALDRTLYADISALVASKTDNPILPYNPTIYGRIQADIVNCKNAYAAIPKSGLSLNQLADLADAVSIFKMDDSLNSSPAFFQLNGPDLINIAFQLDTLEVSKINQP